MSSFLRDEPEERKIGDGELSMYTLTAKSEIVFVLKSLMRKQALVNLEIPGTGKMVVSSVLDVDGDDIVLDGAQGESANRDLVSRGGAEFLAQLDGVSITFKAGAMRLEEYDSLPALRLEIPERLVRLQRREHFRVALPVANPVKCVVPMGPGPDGKARPSAQARLIDISCGGVALAGAAGSGLEAEPGEMLKECKILLPDEKPLIATLEVRNKAEIRLTNGAMQTRLGCRFVDLGKDMTAMLQRFVMQVERERRGRI